ncbi:MAG: hypothetical protein ACOX3T_02575 [Bdellovibrionota bacterium]
MPSFATLQKISGLERVSLVHIGAESLCAISDNKLFCLGDNDKGQIGNGGTDTVKTPQMVLPNFNISKVDAIDYTRCATATSKELFCWRDNSSGRVGANSQDEIISRPTKVLDNVDSISVSWRCAL